MHIKKPTIQRWMDAHPTAELVVELCNSPTSTGKRLALSDPALPFADFFCCEDSRVPAGIMASETKAFKTWCDHFVKADAPFLVFKQVARLLKNINSRPVITTCYTLVKRNVAVAVYK